MTEHAVLIITDNYLTDLKGRDLKFVNVGSQRIEKKADPY